ncbi:serine/threonine protein kinase [Nocardia uniformis]|uniref:Serine/threonine protein kinase n=1 Tax=Nocardia uniformis TaxID=53432 RepID=A0A849C7M6_9NOCA|nr:serine/threonine-protein kinase [Nocardia uniformis]NNH71877.1 serine/threonine protein kinase [Nocardia uniformis]
MIVQPLVANDPQVIGRYRVLGVLGSGGMGRVLLGIGPDGRFVAIKQIHAHLLDEPEYRARFRREVSASTRVSGAFTAPVIDFDVDGHTPWLASVFVVGMPLDKAVQENGPLPIPVVRLLAAGLAVALQEIHRSGLVHRDLKPGNVLLTADGPRVIDFGIALLTENPSGLTEAGSTVGSPAYMSPEQALSESVSYPSDMFSLGSLLFMAATGASPFVGGSLAYTLFNIAHTAPNLEPLPPELRGLVQPCLHKDPRARPTPAQFLEHIGRLSEQTMPWPASIHGAIDQQARELVALTANPDATQVVSMLGSTTTRSAGLRPGQAKPDATSAQRRVARQVVFAALAVLMLVVAGIAWGRVSGDPMGAEADGSMLTRLREADTCAWLRQALDGSVPDGSGWPTDISTWQFSTSWNWGCEAETAGGKMVVEAGDNLQFYKPTGQEIDGLAIFGATTGAGYCARAANLSDIDEQWGVSVRINGDEERCGLVDHVLTRLMSTRDTVPALTDSASLAVVDPCGLVSWDFLNDATGPIPKKPSEFSAHSCVWEGSQPVKIELRRFNNLSVERSIDLGDGTSLDVQAQPVTTSVCTLYYTYQEVGDQREAVTVSVSGGSGGQEGNCVTGESVMRQLIPELPKLN